MKFNSASVLHIRIEHADAVNKLYFASSCELNNPPKTSPKCIHNSKVHDEAFAICL